MRSDRSTDHRVEDERMKLVPLLSLTAVLGLLSADLLDAQRLTLEEAIASAREQNDRLQAERQMAEAAAGEVRFSRGAFLPTLGAAASYSQFSGDVFFARFVPAIPGVPPVDAVDVGDFDSTESLFLTFSQPIYAGGGNGAKLEASRVEQTIAEQDVSVIEDDLIFDVTQAYLQVLLADKALAVARNGAQRTEQNLKSVKDLFQEREALEVDVMAAETQLASDQHSLLAAENDKRFATLALNRLLGRDQDTAIEPVDILGQARELGAEAEALARAQANNPEILKAALRVKLADAGIKGARSHHHPKLGFAGIFSRIDNESLLKGNFWSAGLNLSIPFARDWAEGAGAVAEAEAKKRAAESALEETTSAVLLAARHALSEVSEAERLVEVAERSRKYHEEKYRVTSSAFTESLKTFDDLLDEHVDLSEAELALYQAQYKARLAEAEVRKLLGER
jgi:outer membrane protein